MVSLPACGAAQAALPAVVRIDFFKVQAEFDHSVTVPEQGVGTALLHVQATQLRVSADVVPTVRRCAKPVGHTWSPSLAMHIVNPTALGRQRNVPEHPTPLLDGGVHARPSVGSVFVIDALGAHVRGPVGEVSLAKPVLAPPPTMRSLPVGVQTTPVLLFKFVAV